MDITPLDVQYEDVQEEGAAAPDVVVTGSSPQASGPRMLGRDSPDRGVVPVDTDLPVQCAGYLQKQGRRFRGWHQRWFEIQGQHMYYYKTSAKSQCLGEIELSICTQVQPTSAATFGVSFEVQTTERSHVLAARTSDDMQKWIQCIKSNMGPREGTKQTKTTKMKKWDSFRNAFSINPRNRSPEPAESRKKADVSRNKSFFDRFKKRNRARSPAAEYRKTSDAPGGEVQVALRHSERGQSPRPLSVRSEDMPTSHLYPPDLPVAVSLPATPLTAKKENYETAEHISQSPSSSSIKTPGSNLSSAISSPEHLPKFDPSPVHTSTPFPKQESSPRSPEEAPPGSNNASLESKDVSSGSKEASPGSKEATAVKSSPPKPKPPPRAKRSTTKLKQQTSSSSVLSEILEERLAWDEIREMLDSLPEKKEQLSYDELPPEDETWLEKDTPMEQLREFLAVCA